MIINHLKKEDKMTKAKLQSIGNKISKIYCVPNPIIERKNAEGNKASGYEIRTELPSYEGGDMLQAEIKKVFPDYIPENQGGCIYFVYRP